MDYSDGESESNGESGDDILGPEDLFNDEADEEDTAQNDLNEAPEKITTQEEDSKEKVEKKIRQPKIVKNPRITLNVDLLSGKNGLSALKKLFTNFKFKGNGHEKEDLTKILGILQQWMCYQLCPSYSFESCMLQLEALGKKKVVQTLMKKYRLGIDDWGESKSHDEDNLENDKNMEVEENISRTNNFDLPSNEDNPGTENNIEPSQGDVTGRQYTQLEEEFTLTQEQLERIARNRKLAEERKRKMMSTHFEQMDADDLVQRSGDPEVAVENAHLEDIN